MPEARSGAQGAPSLSDLPPSTAWSSTAVISLQTAPQAPRKPDQLHTVLHSNQEPTEGLGRIPFHVPGTPWSPSPASIWKRAQPGPTPKCLCPRVIHSHREHTEGFKGVQRALPTTAQCPTVLHSGQECTEGFKGSAHTCPMSQDFSEWPGAGRGPRVVWVVTCLAGDTTWWSFS